MKKAHKSSHKKDKCAVIRQEIAAGITSFDLPKAPQAIQGAESSTDSSKSHH